MTPKMRGRLLRGAKFASLLLVSAGVLAGVALRLDRMHEATQESSPASESGAEDRELFFALLSVGLLKHRSDGGLDMAPPDLLLIDKAAALSGTGGVKLSAGERATRRRLLRAYYSSAVGAIVRQQVQLWNGTRSIAAIRDSRAQAPGVTLNHWRAGDPSGHPIKGGALVPESFGFVHGGRLLPGLGEWLSTSGQRGTVTFRTEIAVKKPMVLTLQVVGRPVKLPPGATVTRMKGDMKWPCHGEAEAARVSVKLRPSRGKRRIEVRVRPAAHCAPRVHGLAIRLERDGDGKYTEFGWRPVKRAKPGGSFVLRTADGVPLTDLNGSGRPTEAAYLYNLVPIVGFGTADTFSLAGMLARTPLPSTGLDVRLTI
ncbi:MAG: hypothetical protein V3S44_05935, partial [Alphaproteobacteria bacterium]